MTTARCTPATAIRSVDPSSVIMVATTGSSPSRWRCFRSSGPATPTVTVTTCTKSSLHAAGAAPPSEDGDPDGVPRQPPGLAGPQHTYGDVASTLAGLRRAMSATD